MKAILSTSIFLFLTFLPKLSLAQKDVTHQQLIWYAYFLTVPIDQKWSVVAEVQERHFVHPFAQHQWSLRAHAHLKLGESGWEASGGFAAFFQSPNNPRSTVNLIVPELRAHVEMAYRQKLNKLTLDHRYRVEARFFHQVDLSETKLAEGYFFGGIRFRYRIMASYPIWKINDNQLVKLLLGDELMVQTGKRVLKTFDQNRLIAGFNLVFSPVFNTDITYQKWISQRPLGGYYNRDILRLTANYKLAKKKSSI